MQSKKKDPSKDESLFLVEHLEKSSPLIIEEVHRWRDLLWDEYLDYRYCKNRSTDAYSPSGL
jgi:hypothetical protein